MSTDKALHMADRLRAGRILLLQTRVTQTHETSATLVFQFPVTVVELTTLVDRSAVSGRPGRQETRCVELRHTLDRNMACRFVDLTCGFGSALASLLSPIARAECLISLTEDTEYMESAEPLRGISVVSWQSTPNVSAFLFGISAGPLCSRQCIVDYVSPRDDDDRTHDVMMTRDAFCEFLASIVRSLCPSNNVLLAPHICLALHYAGIYAPSNADLLSYATLTPKSQSQSQSRLVPHRAYVTTTACRSF
jgi:hypothetical protein